MLNLIIILYSIVIILALNVVLNRNLIISIISLIIIYLSVSITFISPGARFLGIMLIIVHAGAISILSSPVIMLLNQRLIELYNNFSIYYILIISSIILFSTFLFIIYCGFINFYLVDELFDTSWLVYSSYISDVKNIGNLLLNHFKIYILISGLILLLGMLGSISITLDYSGKKYFCRKSENILIKNKISYYGVIR